MQFDEMCQINRLPLSFDLLLQYLYEKEIRQPDELLVSIVYYLFLESGFIPKTLPSEFKSKIVTHWGFSFVAQIPQYSWKIAADDILKQHLLRQRNVAAATEHVYEFELNLLNHSDEEMQLVIRKVFGGSALCVTFCLSQQSQASSIILPVNEFINLINTTECFENIQQNPQNYFRNVRELSEKVKQNLIAPLRNIVMYASAYPNAALHGMPQEILWNLFSYLRHDLQMLQKISQTCVYLRNITITFLNESKIQLKHRQPTPIIYDPLDRVHHGSQYRIFNDFSGFFFPENRGYRPLNYYFYHR